MTSDNHRATPRGPVRHRLGLVGLRPAQGWERHPALLTGNGPSRSHRAAELARDGLGSWGFAAVGAAAVWVAIVLGVRRDHHQGLAAVLSLALSGLAVVELSILLMTTRLADRIAAEVALYDLESDRRAAAGVEDLRDEVERLRGDVARLTARLQSSARPLDGPGEPLP